MTELDWTGELVEQLDPQWKNQARPRLDGLSDAEYIREHVPGWNVRPRTAGTPSDAPGSGTFTIDFSYRSPFPPQ